MLAITTAAAVRTAGKGDERAVLSSLTLAFSTDPAARWLYPDPHQFLTHFPEFARAFGGRAFEHGSAYMTEGYCGAALWLPPGVQPDDQTIWELVERTASPPIQSDMAGIFEQMASYHPREPHWYLPLIGVEPAYQNRGYGAALLRTYRRRRRARSSTAMVGLRSTVRAPPPVSTSAQRTDERNESGRCGHTTCRTCGQGVTVHTPSYWPIPC